jgi:lipid A ethanolaminephosphotransferase
MPDVLQESMVRRLLSSHRIQPSLSPEALIVVVAAHWAVVAHGPFFDAVLRDRSLADPAAWGLAAAVALAVVALHALLLGLVGARALVKPVLGVLTLVVGITAYFVRNYGVVLDPDMARNVLRTHPAEAGELLTLGLAWHTLWVAGPVLWLLWRVQLTPLSWGRALLRRAGLLLGAWIVLIAAIGSVYGPLASLMRNHREIRYLITPANVLWSTSAALAREVRGATQPRTPIGLDAEAGPSWRARTRPLVVLLVVGESARDVDWGPLSAQVTTTPRLDKLPVIRIRDVRACGTNTEASLPCMFAPVGRRDYDESRIRGQESLLHVLARAGVGVHWRDNQSGCKGVCDGLPGDRADSVPDLDPTLCPQGRCFDEALVRDLGTRLASASGTQLWALHMIGSHGPSYFRRVPPAFERFEPTCREDELQRCSLEAIRNAYRNTLVYTDNVLATAIQALQAQADRVDSALVYVSDHGESLGERGLFLHGFPYAIAPGEQTRVPMVLWASSGFTRSVGLSEECFQALGERLASIQVTHDHLFHTLLGFFDVTTALYEPAWDLSSACRGGAARPAP